MEALNVHRPARGGARQGSEASRDDDAHHEGQLAGSPTAVRIAPLSNAASTLKPSGKRGVGDAVIGDARLATPRWTVAVTLA